MCLAWAPAMLGKEAPPGPAGRPAVPLWQDRQVPVPVAVRVGSATLWQVLQSGALAAGLVPEMAWQLEQSLVKVAAVVATWAPPRKGTAWFGWPGPFTWQATALAEAEKQLGAVASGAMRPLVPSWQSAQATARLPASRWEAA